MQRFFGEAFAGTLIHDFWAPYESIDTGDRQYCLVHLLRELEKVDQHNTSPEWKAFAKKLRRLLGDSIRLWRRRDEMPQGSYASRRQRLAARLQELIDTPWKDRHAKRLVKRLRRHQNDLFTFLDQPDVPFDNNTAERGIRPAVIIRKNSYGNRSQRGADCQAVLMSIFRTLKQRGHDPIRTIVKALAEYLTTGKLPPLPEPKPTSGG